MAAPFQGVDSPTVPPLPFPTPPLPFPTPPLPSPSPSTPFPSFEEYLNSRGIDTLKGDAIF